MSCRQFAASHILPKISSASDVTRVTKKLACAVTLGMAGYNTTTEDAEHSKIATLVVVLEPGCFAYLDGL